MAVGSRLIGDTPTSVSLSHFPYDSEGDKPKYLPVASPILNVNTNNDASYCGASIDILVSEDHSSPWRILPIAPKVGSDHASEESLSKVRQWLDCCEEYHRWCCFQNGSAIPSRLLMLRDKDINHIKLVENCKEIARYACLSHRWGKSRPVVTTTQSLNAHKRGIPMEILPRTFQDAIQFTRKLGIDYLWIDSLCILQDSKSDWEKEASNMANIFENAYLTLAATGSRSSINGCSSRNAEHEISGNTIDGHPYTVYARRRITHFDLFNPYQFLEDEYDYLGHAMPRLLRRGWVYQERLLSRRVLHFGSEELYWECMEDAWCQCWSRAEGDDEYTRKRILPKVAHGQALASSNARLLQIRWRQMVSEYSGLELTYTSDRLPGIAGAANQMGRFRQDRYLWGLWEGCLAEDLLWRTLGVTVLPRPEIWHAPSWSWASVDDKVCYPEASYASTLPNECKISCCSTLIYVEVSIPAFQTHRSCVTMLGSLQRAEICYDIPEVDEDDMDYFSEIPELSPEIFWIRTGDGYQRDFDADYALHTPGLHYIPSGKKVWCFKVAESGIDVYSLVLRRVDHDRYERIGLLQQKLQNETGRDIFWDGAKECTVTIV
ncbi:HET-domain-containing protein [Zopfia rhizophila CBS 207.26]|uniref:HET-domain-containing protein n=1 Tax=Zopfia rhizophila CBS 207.26 TaxID=1314779 RepID=A0A6A6DND9_9PEZI|nr:HET-domain-containing protein [Zopfia rhizophila CBS 207.26]